MLWLLWLLLAETLLKTLGFQIKTGGSRHLMPQKSQKPLKIDAAKSRKPASHSSAPSCSVDFTLAMGSSHSGQPSGPTHCAWKQWKREQRQRSVAPKPSTSPQMGHSKAPDICCCSGS